MQTFAYELTYFAEAAIGRPARMTAELIRDGAPLPIEVRLTPIPGPDGQTAYVLAEGRFAG